MFVILTQGPFSPVLVQTWRSSYADTVGEGVKKLARAQANVPSRFQSRVEHANSIRLSHAVVHHRSSTISRILQFTPRNCTHKKKERRVISGGMLLKKKKKTRYVLFLYMPKRRPKSRSCHRKPLCTRAVLISVSFKSDEHQYSSSRASATDEPNATLRRVSSLQMTPTHSHSSRSSSSRHSRKEVDKRQTGYQIKSIINDLEKRGKSNTFTGASWRTIKELGNIELYKLGEISKTVQCQTCLSCSKDVQRTPHRTHACAHFSHCALHT